MKTPLLAATLAAFGMLLVAVRRNRTARFDLAVSVQLQTHASPRFAGIMRAASWPGFPPQSRIIPPLVIAAWWAAGHRRAAVFQSAAWGAALLSTGIKLLVERPRPLAEQVQIVLAPLSGSSFPSGHVLTYVGFYGFLARLLATHLRPRSVRWLSVSAVVGLVCAVGPSRVQQGHHWATDVIASYLLGTAYVLGLEALYDRSGRLHAEAS